MKLSASGNNAILDLLNSTGANGIELTNAGNSFFTGNLIVGGSSQYGSNTFTVTGTEHISGALTLGTSLDSAYIANVVSKILSANTFLISGNSGGNAKYLTIDTTKYATSAMSGFTSYIEKAAWDAKLSSISGNNPISTSGTVISADTSSTSYGLATLNNVSRNNLKNADSTTVKNNIMATLDTANVARLNRRESFSQAQTFLDTLKVYNASTIAKLVIDNGVSTNGGGFSQLRLFASASQGLLNRKNFAITNANASAANGNNVFTIQGRNDDGSSGNAYLQIYHDSTVNINNYKGAGLPVTSGTAQTYGILRLTTSGVTSVLDIGNDGGTYGNWLQSTSSVDLSQNYPLLLNPNGGRIGVGITTAPVFEVDIGGTSTIGALTYSGSHLNDATLGGTYNGISTQTLRVQIYKTGTPDTLEWSIDGGVTWTTTHFEHSSDLLNEIPITVGAIPLNYSGVTITFGATTGHTLGDYWQTTLTPNNGIVNNTGGYNLNGALFTSSFSNNNFSGLGAMGGGKVTGTWNDVNGISAGYHITTGTLNTLKGYSSGFHITTASNNTTNGGNTLYWDSTGSGNVADGTSNSLYNNGDNNTDHGYAGLYSALNVNNTVGDGYSNLLSLIEGSWIFAGGANAGYGMKRASYVTILGGNVLLNDTIPDNSTVIGASGFKDSRGGSGLVGLGYSCGRHDTSSNVFYVNNVDQLNITNDRNCSLIYGVFAGTAGTTNGQSLTLNGNLIIQGTSSGVSQSGITLSSSLSGSTINKGIYFNPTQTSISSNGFYGIDARPLFNDVSGSTQASVYGADYIPQIASTATSAVTDFYGNLVRLDNLSTSGSVVTNAHGIYIANPTATGTITNNYGLHIANQSNGSSKNYAIFLEGQTGYAIYSNGGRSYFKDSIGINILTPLAPLHIGNPNAGWVRLLKLGTGNSTLNDGNYIEFPSSGTDGYGARIGGIRDGTGGSNALVFQTGTNAQKERMRITNGGNVDIGNISSITAGLAVQNGLFLNAQEWYNSRGQDIGHKDSVGNETITGKLSTGGNTVEGAYGVPNVNDTINYTGVGASIGTTNFSNTATGHMYRISYYLHTTTISTSGGTVSFTCSWNDGAVQSFTSATELLSATGITGMVSDVQVFYVASGTPTWSTTVAGVIVGSPQYSLQASLERIW